MFSVSRARLCSKIARPAMARLQPSAAMIQRCAISSKPNNIFARSGSILGHSSSHFNGFHSSAISQAKVPFMLADIGEGITECEVIQWFVKAGDNVEEFDRLCEVQSDKASVEITSRFTGTIVDLKYKVGDMAKVGSALVEIETGDDDASTINADAPADHATAAIPAVVTESVTTISTPGTEDIVVATTTTRVEPPTAEHILTFATPAVRRVAKENNVDIKLIKGSGKGGRVNKEDVMSYLANGRQSTADAVQASPSSVPKPSVPVGEDKVLPLNMIQKAMFKQMTKSLTIPHFGFADEIVLDNTIAFRTAVNEYLAKNADKYSFKKISYMPIFIKALSTALEEYPIMNARVLDGESASTAKIQYRASHNIGVAMDTPAGLIVPNIKNVQSLSVLEIAAELARLQEAGKRNAISMPDLKDGTVTLSNVGNIGGTYLNPVVVTSEVAIAAVGKMQRLPRFKMVEDANGQLVEKVVAQQVVNVSWSADHRVVDGATIARFSEKWKTVVENPLLLGGLLR